MAKERKKEEETKVGGWSIPIPEGAEFGGLPPGTYLSRCSEEPKETMSSEGAPQTEFAFTVCDPEFPDYEGREGKYWCSQKPKAWWNLTNTLDAMKVPYEIQKGESGRPKFFNFDPMDCVGAMCRTVWAERVNPRTGAVRSRIQRVISTEEEIEELGGEEPPF